MQDICDLSGNLNSERRAYAAEQLVFHLSRSNEIQILISLGTSHTWFSNQMEYDPSGYTYIRSLDEIIRASEKAEEGFGPLVVETLLYGSFRSVFSQTPLSVLELICRQGRTHQLQQATFAANAQIDPVLRCISLCVIAQWQFNHGDRSIAISSLLIAEKVANNLAEPKDRANTLSRVAESQLAVGNHEAGMRSFRRALRELEVVQKEADRLRTAVIIGLAGQRSGASEVVSEMTRFIYEMYGGDFLVKIGLNYQSAVIIRDLGLFFEPDYVIGLAKNDLEDKNDCFAAVLRISSQKNNEHVINKVLEGIRNGKYKLYFYQKLDFLQALAEIGRNDDCLEMITEMHQKDPFPDNFSFEELAALARAAGIKGNIDELLEIANIAIKPALSASSFRISRLYRRILSAFWQILESVFVFFAQNIFGLNDFTRRYILLSGINAYLESHKYGIEQLQEYFDCARDKDWPQDIVQRFQSRSIETIPPNSGFTRLLRFLDKYGRMLSHLSFRVNLWVDLLLYWYLENSQGFLLLLGLVDDTIEIACMIQDEKMQSELLKKTALYLSRQGNIQQAIAVSRKISDRSDQKAVYDAISKKVIELADDRIVSFIPEMIKINGSLDSAIADSPAFEALSEIYARLYSLDDFIIWSKDFSPTGRRCAMLALSKVILHEQDYGAANRLLNYLRKTKKSVDNVIIGASIAAEWANAGRKTLFWNYSKKAFAKAYRQSTQLHLAKFCSTIRKISKKAEKDSLKKGQYDESVLEYNKQCIKIIQAFELLCLAARCLKNRHALIQLLKPIKQLKKSQKRSKCLICKSVDLALDRSLVHITAGLAATGRFIGHRGLKHPVIKLIQRSQERALAMVEVAAETRLRQARFLFLRPHRIALILGKAMKDLTQGFPGNTITKLLSPKLLISSSARELFNKFLENQVNISISQLTGGKFQTDSYVTAMDLEGTIPALIRSRTREILKETLAEIGKALVRENRIGAIEDALLRLNNEQEQSCFLASAAEELATRGRVNDAMNLITLLSKDIQKAFPQVVLVKVIAKYDLEAAKRLLSTVLEFAWDNAESERRKILKAAMSAAAQMPKETFRMITYRVLEKGRSFGRQGALEAIESVWPVADRFLNPYQIRDTAGKIIETDIWWGLGGY